MPKKAGAATAGASTVLVIHAEDDKEVPADHARRYGAVGPNVELHWANGLGHRRIVSAAPVIERITEFLWERRKEAPMSKIA